MEGVSRILRPFMSDRRDKRKLTQFKNIARYFAKVNCRMDMIKADVLNAEALLIRSYLTMLDNMVVDLDMESLTGDHVRVLRFVEKNPGCSLNQVRMGLGKTGPKAYQNLKRDVQTLVDMSLLYVLNQKLYIYNIRYYMEKKYAPGGVLCRP